MVQNVHDLVSAQRQNVDIWKARSQSQLRMILRQTQQRLFQQRGSDIWTRIMTGKPLLLVAVIISYFRLRNDTYFCVLKHSDLVPSSPQKQQKSGCGPTCFWPLKEIILNFD